MASFLQNSDALAVHRSGVTYHFLLADLNEYFLATGITCNITDGDEPDPNPYGTLWHNTTDTHLKAVNEDGDWIDVAAPVSLVTTVGDYILSNDLEIEALKEELKKLAERVSKNEGDIKDLQFTANNHEGRITALEGTILKGIYQSPGTYKAEASIAPGEIYFKDGSDDKVADYNDITNVCIHQEDKQGQNPPIETFAINDVIRVNGPATVGCSLQITDVLITPIDDGTQYYKYLVSVLGVFDTPKSDVDLEIEFLKSFDPTLYATIEYSDDQDELKVSKIGDEMTGSIVFKGSNTGIMGPTASDGSITWPGIGDKDIVHFGSAGWLQDGGKYTMGINVTKGKVDIGLGGAEEMRVKGKICIQNNEPANNSMDTSVANRSVRLDASGIQVTSGFIELAEQSSQHTSAYNTLKIRGRKNGSEIMLLKTYHFKGSIKDNHDYIEYDGKVSSDKGLTNKKYVDDKIKEQIDANPAVELYNSSSPPSTRDRGSLLMTSGSVLYIYI